MQPHQHEDIVPRFTAQSLSLDALQQMINQRRYELQKLERQRAKLQRKVAAIDRRITAIGGHNGHHRRPGRWARNEVSLADAIAAVLSRVTSAIGVGDIAEKVQASGYRSGSGNFRGIVNQTLINDRRFVAAERGKYRFKGRASKGAAPKTRTRKRGPTARNLIPATVGQGDSGTTTS